MKPRTFLAIPLLGAILALAPGLPRAQSADGARPQAAPGAEPGDAGAADAAAQGKELAEKGIPAKSVAACTSCHGAHGEGNADAGFPRLAGQPADYLARQLEAYADGSRASAVMAPIAQGLGSEQRQAVAAYYAGLSAPAGRDDQDGAGDGAGKGNGQADGADEARQRGATLATVGDERIQVQACANCHGAQGAGEPPDYPALAGQHAPYLKAALGEFKTGARKTDPSGQMPTIARRLSNEDIAAVTAYYAGQPPDADWAARREEALTLRRRAAQASGQAAPAPQHPPPQDGGPAGAEQGAPTTGNQGPGGAGSNPDAQRPPGR